MAPPWKGGSRATGSGVRISPLPPCSRRLTVRPAAPQAVYLGSNPGRSTLCLHLRRSVVGPQTPNLLTWVRFPPKVPVSSFPMKGTPSGSAQVSKTCTSHQFPFSFATLGLADTTRKPTSIRWFDSITLHLVRVGSSPTPKIKSRVDAHLTMGECVAPYIPSVLSNASVAQPGSSDRLKIYASQVQILPEAL